MKDVQNFGLWFVMGVLLIGGYWFLLTGNWWTLKAFNLYSSLPSINGLTGK